MGGESINTTSNIYDVIIIGGGPAGLMSAHELIKSKREFLILEKGKHLNERSYQIASDVPSGFGGSGLFSDGKLSFPPAATKLWTMTNNLLIKEAYTRFQSILKEIDVDILQWDESWLNKDFYEFGERKEYDSFYLTSKQRVELNNYLYSRLNAYIKFNSEVISISKEEGFYIIETKDQSCYKAKYVVFSAGKYGSILLEKVGFISREYNYIVEAGVRIETLSDLLNVYNDKSIDYKFIKKINDSVEIRTFCCCKDGSVLESKFDDFVSYNGYSLDEKTNHSNIGVLIRIKTENSPYGKEINELLKNISKKKISLSEYMDNNFKFIGKNCDSIIKEYIGMLVNLNEDAVLNNTSVYGPEIEYIGKYPLFDYQKLKMVNEKVWVPGDCSGQFRGLVAALVSGIYCAQELNDDLEQVENSIKFLNIKKSKIDTMKLIFTAQSKVYFYCRDIICEYVLKKELLPINPFRVFDYFLSDRVPRDIIRRGNNQLIQTCEELWVFGPIADGVLFEIALAKKHGKKIKYFTIGSKIEEIFEIREDDVVFEPEVHAKQVKKIDLISFIKSNENPIDPQLKLFGDTNE
ncbi:NAD(P)/FAD-dependent oxidoreductase [Desulfosporosinus sp. Sb-LF]|uniref:DUF7768 domain-containing protein n=1 Tax=Desulfosporosinus sp. Sb-LF TaxID=2560027 RepID=UPI0013050C5C|nr:NAD(P)/FAD-dependent oxidoreductase [Desulfosporosinus sp. Sb-LF]